MRKCQLNNNLRMEARKSGNEPFGPTVLALTTNNSNVFVFLISVVGKMKTVNIDVVTVQDNSFPSSLTFQPNKLERLPLHPSQLFASEARANSSGALLEGRLLEPYLPMVDQ
jgi:hypothetical protein